MNPAPDIHSKPPCRREDALAVLQRLRTAGHVAYFAGGCVRDTLLGHAPKDWDVVTDAPPQRVRELFSNTQAVGAAFGVILVRQGGSVVEVATFRADGIYLDGRRPSSVRFTSAEEDAQRRDFTINGIFLDPLADRVIDYVGGRADLEARILRAVGIPSARFEEDHLRLLRAVRFAARFDLTIDPATAAAITAAAPRLKGISPERIGEELRHTLTPPTRAHAWKLLWELHLAPQLFRFLPDIPTAFDPDRSIFLNLSPAQSIPIGLSLAAATLCVRRQAQSLDDLSPLLSRTQVAASVRAMRHALRISNDESEEMAQILTSLETLLQSSPPTLAQKKRFLAQTTSALSRFLMDAIAQVGLHVNRIAALQPDLTELSRGDVAPAPLVTGQDLLAQGIPPGPIFKKIIEAAYDAQLEGKISTKTQALELAVRLHGR